MRKFYPFFTFVAISLLACSGAPAPETSAEAVKSDEVRADTVAQVSTEVTADADALPASYKDIVFPEYRYVAPHPRDYRVKITDSITGYVVADRSLPLVNLSVFFDEPHPTASIKD